jgi:AraC-like DNA-binding protein
MAPESPIQRFSTDTVPPGMRFDYWMSILRQSLWPVSDWTIPRDFNVELREAALGCLSSMWETIGPSNAHRTRRDVDNSGDRCYLLFANRSPWSVSHRGLSERYAAGDVVLVDSQGELVTSAPSGFTGTIVKLPVAWVHTWLPDPSQLVGRRISRDSRWGRALSPMVAQLTPELAAAPPLPPGILVDQLGAILALVAADADEQLAPDLLRTIRDRVRQRCSEPYLTGDEVARSLNLPPQILHRALAAQNTTFASLLLRARTDLARRMSNSRASRQLTAAEIGRLAGFTNASYFGRVWRKRTGRSPLQGRRSRH